MFNSSWGASSVALISPLIIAMEVLIRGSEKKLLGDRVPWAKGSYGCTCLIGGLEESLDGRQHPLLGLLLFEEGGIPTELLQNSSFITVAKGSAQKVNS